MTVIFFRYIRNNLNSRGAHFKITHYAGYLVCTTWLRLFLHIPKKFYCHSLINTKDIIHLFPSGKPSGEIWFSSVNKFSYLPFEREINVLFHYHDYCNYHYCILAIETFDCFRKCDVSCYKSSCIPTCYIVSPHEHRRVPPRAFSLENLMRNQNRVIFLSEFSPDSSEFVSSTTFQNGREKVMIVTI